MNVRGPLPLILTVALGLALAGTVTFPGVRQGLQDQQQLTQELQGLQAVIATQPAEVAHGKQLATEYEQLKHNLPDDEEFPQVITTLQDAQHLLGLTPGTITRSVHPSTVPGVTAVDLDVVLHGSYARVQSFVQSLSNLSRAYTTQGVVITPDPAGGVNADLKLTTYKRTPPGASPAPTGTLNAPAPVNSAAGSHPTGNPVQPAPVTTSSPVSVSTPSAPGGRP